MREAPSRPGRPAQIRVTERFLRKRRLLEADERILELKQGKLRRWLVYGSDQPIPKLFGLEHVPILSGLTTFSYSPRFLFINGAKKHAVTDLAFIVRVWTTRPRSLCVIFTSFDEQSAGSVVSVRWDSDEDESYEDLVGFADRIRARARVRRAGFSPYWQTRIENRASEVTGGPGFEPELALLDEAAADAARLGPQTVVGRWLRASILGMPEEDRLKPLLNGGKPGWNDDEPGVIQAASELAARRYFGPEVSSDEVTATAAQVIEWERRGADLRGRAGLLPDKTYVQAVIRHDTGDLPTGWHNIRPSVALHIRGAFIFFVALKLDIMFELDQLIRDAEALAFERGLKPPLLGVAGQRDGGS